MTVVGRVGWRRWLATAVVVLLVVFLTFGWQLAATRLRDEVTLPAHTRLSFDGVGSVVISDGGWRLSRSNTSWRSWYLLQHGAMRVLVQAAWYDRVVTRASAWEGLHQILRTRGGTLGSPHTTGPGVQVANLRHGSFYGFAAVVLNADAYAAVEVEALGPPDTAPSDRAAARALLLGINPNQVR